MTDNEEEEEEEHAEEGNEELEEPPTLNDYNKDREKNEGHGNFLVA